MGFVSMSERSPAGVVEFDRECAAKLADSEQVHACYIDHVFAFAAGRIADEDADACTLDGLESEFTASGGSLTDLLVAYTRSDSFRYRRRDP